MFPANSKVEIHCLFQKQHQQDFGAVKMFWNMPHTDIQLQININKALNKNMIRLTRVRKKGISDIGYSLLVYYYYLCNIIE